MLSRLLSPLSCLLLLSGCLFTGPDCIYELRNVQLETTFPEGIRVYVSLDEERDAGSDHVTSRRIFWAVTGSLGDDTLIGVHLHRGNGGPVIATLPIQNARLGIVLTDGDAFEPSFLALSYDEVFAILRVEPVYVDLHTTKHPEGRVLGKLEVTYDNPWVHPYCS